MTLAGIAVLAVLALLTWQLRGLRPDALLIVSLVTFYTIQSETDAYALLLPTVGVLLVAGVWWLTARETTARDSRTVILITLAAGAGMLLRLVTANQIGPESLRALPILALGGITVFTAGAALRPSAMGDSQAAEAGSRRVALLLVIGVIGLFALLKLPTLQAELLGRRGLPPLGWVGFSYIAFRLLHVLLDYRIGRLPALGLRDFSLYVLFFPALTAGPIARIEHFQRELNATPVAGARLLEGGRRIGIGLLKKFVIADSLALLALNDALAAQTHSAIPLWIMLYAYALRLFFDFSGYTDIAIGIGLWAGLKLPENFDAPYFKRNIAAFWNAWHITLSTWFRLYFFMPLSRTLMMPASPLRRYKLAVVLIAQVATMILIGLWHGAALNFVLWGAYHGVGLWLHKTISDRLRGWDAFVAARPPLARVITVGSVVFTFHFVAVGWVFFALSDSALIGRTLAGLVGGG